MRETDGVWVDGDVRRWLMRGAWGVWLAVAVMGLWAPLCAVSAGERRGFDAVRQGLDRQLHVRGKGVPMMWAVSLAARGFTGNGVRGLRVVEYERLPPAAVVDRVALEQTVRRELGTEWSPIIRDRSEGETSLVYVQPAGGGKLVRMIVVDLEGQEVNLVRMELSPDALARWQKHEDR